MATEDGWFKFPDIHSGLKHVSTKNIATPCLQFTVVFTPICFLAAWMLPAYAAVLLGAGCIPPALGGLTILYWTFKDPDRLQDETTQVEMSKLRLQLGDSLSGLAPQNMIDVTPSSNTAIVTTGSAAASPVAADKTGGAS